MGYGTKYSTDMVQMFLRPDKKSNFFRPHHLKFQASGYSDTGKGVDQRGAPDFPRYNNDDGGDKFDNCDNVIMIVAPDFPRYNDDGGGNFYNVA